MYTRALYLASQGLYTSEDIRGCCTPMVDLARSRISPSMGLAGLPRKNVKEIRTIRPPSFGLLLTKNLFKCFIMDIVATEETVHHAICQINSFKKSVLVIVKITIILRLSYCRSKWFMICDKIIK